MPHFDVNDRVSQLRDNSWMRSFRRGMSTLSDLPQTPKVLSRKKRTGLYLLIFLAGVLTAALLTNALSQDVKDALVVKQAEPIATPIAAASDADTVEHAFDATMLDCILEAKDAKISDHSAFWIPMVAVYRPDGDDFESINKRLRNRGASDPML